MNQLSGVKVLELASVLAGPAVGQFFAEAGADVIKVENIRAGGDVTRTWKVAGEQTDDRSAYFCSINWGKRSIALDLNIAEGQEIVHKLAGLSDIVIASYKPGDAAKLKVDYESLRTINSEVIYGQITGYGSKNPKVGYDAIIQAETGFMYMNGLPGGPSLKMPVALMDVLAGHHLKEGLLLAMLEKTKTGKGCFVEVSLIQAAVASLVNQATNWLIAGKSPEKHGSAHPNIAPYGDVFLTADGQELLLAVGNDRQFQDLCRVIEKEDVLRDPRFSTNSKRVTNRKELHEALAAAIKNFASHEIVRNINAFKIPGGLIQKVQQVFEMPEVEEIMLAHEGIRGIRSFVASDGKPLSSHFQPPPHLGEHTSMILEKSLGYSSKTVELLRLREVIN
jgi:crotonobetainyl-CoA:carnitine CoA-transferase CaiB-like acyl-CoA transferase